MRNYQDDKVIQKHESSKRLLENYKGNRRKHSSNNLEARVKALEDTVAALVAKQENKEEV
jgi:hypothetical protein